MSVGVQLAADDKSATRRHFGVLRVCFYGRLEMGQGEARVIEDLGTAGLVHQPHRTAEVGRRRTHRHVRPETLCARDDKPTQRRAETNRAAIAGPD